jgi:hypothetical protein
MNEAESAVYGELSQKVRKLKTWKETIQTCLPEARLSPPPTETELQELERALGHGLPESLRGLLSETNGIDHPHAGWSVHDTRTIIEMNLEFRAPEYLADLRMPFDHLLFVGGQEDPFAFPRLKNGTLGKYVYQWSHESDAREFYAFNLADFLVRFAIDYCR